MTVEKPKAKQLLRPITTGESNAMNQSQLLSETCSKRGKNHAQMARLGLVLLLVGWKTGASLLSQSLSVAIAITQVLSTVIWKLLYNNGCTATLAKEHLKRFSDLDWSQTHYQQYGALEFYSYLKHWKLFSC